MFDWDWGFGYNGCDVRMKLNKRGSEIVLSFKC